MVRRAIVMVVAAAFLLVVSVGCGSEPQPKITAGDNATHPKKDDKSKNVSD
jgi:hypothetical protein